MAELFNDINPNTTVKGLGFKNSDIARKSIERVETYFNHLMKLQKIPGMSLENLKPEKYLKTQKEKKDYYQNQKMSRILSLHNRAKVMVSRIKNPTEMKSAITILKNWILKNKKNKKNNKNNKRIPDCCRHSNKDKECVRESDDKKFKLPRKFNFNQCQDIRGFSMRSSCAPYKDC